MRNVASDLVSHSLGGEDGDFIDNSLVRVEVKRQSSVVLLNDHPGGSLHGLGSDSLFTKKNRRMEMPVNERRILATLRHLQAEKDPTNEQREKRKKTQTMA